MMEAGINPDVVTYNSVMAGATRQQSLSRCLDMLEMGIIPDEFAASGMWKGMMMRLFEELRESVLEFHSSDSQYIAASETLCIRQRYQCLLQVEILHRLSPERPLFLAWYDRLDNV
ncbi:hypothetical protein Salat_1084700 [Sesamum alatum]|uniref:Uncharacterized protein n=1 Tax=Sesamum alatum TaxID=300844 RepID=A0AAE1YNH4_9LAMI|nr:hypothetical protein Salat_1084700 [Sesamum alatum]